MIAVGVPSKSPLPRIHCPSERPEPSDDPTDLPCEAFTHCHCVVLARNLSQRVYRGQMVHAQGYVAALAKYCHTLVAKERASISCSSKSSIAKLHQGPNYIPPITGQVPQHPRECAESLHRIHTTSMCICLPTTVPLSMNLIILIISKTIMTLQTYMESKILPSRS